MSLGRNIRITLVPPENGEIKCSYPNHLSSLYFIIMDSRISKIKSFTFVPNDEYGMI